VELALMIEGQEGVTWDDWLALAAACEESGIETLFRSDHYLSQSGPDSNGSLDAWTTISALAARTSRLRLGTLVSPATFRHPSVLAKAAATADHVSGGRVELGMGAGWMAAEHEAYGFPFPATRERMELLAEQVEIVHRQWTEERFDFEGRHYTLRDCTALPKPVQRPRPRILVGGSGGPGTLRPAVRFADEYNTFLADADEARERRAALDAECGRQGRDPTTIRYSLMVTALVGSDAADAEARARRLYEARDRDEDFRSFVERVSRRALYGSVDEAAERLRRLEREARVDRVMLQHLLHDDLDAVRLIGRELRPAVA
jgi:F420-dependent oxidoreductase-like protein